MVAVAVIGGCSGASDPSSPESGTASGSSKGVAATRWWSDGVHSAGSTIDTHDPTAASAGLHPSRAHYCAVLRDTVQAGRSILPGVGADDPALLASTEAFVATLEHLAPARLASSWRTLGGALITFVRSQGTTLGADASVASVQRAATAIAADAKTRCHLDIGLDSAAPR